GYALNGPLFFGAAEKFRDALEVMARKPRALILEMDDVPVIDSTGVRALHSVVRQCRRRGIRVLLADLYPEARKAIAESELGESFTPGELELSFDDALFALAPAGEWRTVTSESR